MTLLKSDLASFALAVYRSYDLTGLEINEKTALKNLEAELLENFEDLNSSEAKNARSKLFKIGDLEDYRERILDSGDGKKIIYGIRHEGCNPDLPFINCIPNFAIKSKEDILPFVEDLYRELQVFSPKHLCFWSCDKIESDFIGATYLVSSYEEVTKSGPWKKEADIELVKIEDDSFYDWYRTQYERFHLDRPELKSKVTVNQIETMRESLEEKLLYYSYIGDERVGLIAAIRSELLGHEGFYFNEILISSDWKGQGLAKSIQRKFISEKAKKEDLIWGTIDSQNLSSFKTALSNTRKPIRYENFVKI